MMAYLSLGSRLKFAHGWKVLAPFLPKARNAWLT